VFVSPHTGDGDDQVTAKALREELVRGSESKRSSGPTGWTTGWPRSTKPASQGFTISDAPGHGRSPDRVGEWRGVAYDMLVTHKLVIAVFVEQPDTHSST
jgi:hypothetical protein